MSQTKKLQKKGMMHFMSSPHFAKAALENTYFENYERDVLIIDHHNRLIELECKISKSDFVADAKKVEKHYQTEQGKGVSQFYYLLDTSSIRYSEAMRMLGDLPEWSGMLILTEQGFIKEIKKAPIIHNYPITFVQLMEFTNKLFLKKTSFNV